MVLEPGGELDHGRWLFTQDCRFLAGAAKLEQVPPGVLPEVAFAGRSNVGKSRLINALTGRKTLAKVSNTPGRTRQLNFFELGRRLMLADLPGYGYARASKQQVADWTRLVELYLVGRAPLRRALVLIDARHGLKDVDRRVMAMLDKAAVSYQAVLTKTDQLGPAQLTERLQGVAGELVRHTAAHPEVLPTSAAEGSGISELRAALAALIEWRTETET
jgi:GTP-binding protein